MDKKDLTRRQYETLKFIQDFLASKEVLPTLNEFRDFLHVSSDQTVLDLLNRLQEKGYIKRNSKGVRGLSLTEKAEITLGVAIFKVDESEKSIRPSFELDDEQKIVYQKLSDLDSLLGKIYIGGLLILNNKSNPDWIALSAHSFREVVSWLCRRGENLLSEDEVKKFKEQKVSVGARQLERNQDPRGGVFEGVGKTVYDVFWKKFYNEVFTPISHHGKNITSEEYEKMVYEFERFILNYILPSQLEIYSKIDTIIKNGPNSVDSGSLKNLITLTLESYHYFFKKIDGAWLKYIQKNGFILPNWQVAEYLERMTQQFPEEVMDIILEYKIQPSGQLIKTIFVMAARKMPASVAKKVVTRMIKEKWLSCGENEIFLLKDYTHDLIKNLLEGEEYSSALGIINVYLSISQGSDPSDKAIALIDKYQFSETLKSIGTINPAQLEPFIRALIKKLERVCKIESESGKQDYSYIWLPAIEEHSQNWGSDNLGVLLAKAIRDLFEAYIDYLLKNDANNTKDKIVELLKNQDNYSIIKRIKLHIFRIHPEIFLDEISVEIVSSFYQEDIWHEYYLLVKESFGLLDHQVQNNFLELISKGPKDETEEKYVRYWQARRLKMVEKYIKGTEQKKLLKEIKLEDPDFMAPHYSWSGPNSHVSEAELEKMTVAEIVKVLIEWDPPKNDFGAAPSRRGLGHVLSGVIQKNPEKFIDESDKFLDEKINLVYLSTIFYGLRDAANNTKGILNWGLVIVVISKLIKRVDLNETGEKGWNDNESNWETVSLAALGLLRVIINAEGNEDLESFKQYIWDIVATLCEHSDPTLEHELKYGGENMDTYSLSINTVRGEAFHALFMYMIWCNRIKQNKDKSKKSKPRLFVPQEVKNVVQKHLDIRKEPGLTISSVYGKFLPWLILYDQNWVSGIVKEILPSDNRERRIAAWETYLSNTVYAEVYAFMRPYYEIAIDELPVTLPKKKYWANPIDNLAAHVMIGFVFGLDKNKEPLYKAFFSKATSKQRASALSFIGRSLIMREFTGKKEGQANIKKMQDIWNERLEKGDVEELKEFGWWAKENFFKNEWLLKSLLETVRITKGKIEAEHWVIKALKELSVENPLLCGEILNQIIRARDSRRNASLIYQEEIEEILGNVFRGNKSAEKIGDQIVDYLTKMGFESLRYAKENAKNKLAKRHEQN